MPNPMISEILDLCLEAEQSAAATYRAFAGAPADGPLSRFWKSMALQEEEHIHFWEQLAEFNRRGSLRNIFDDPGTVIKQLKAILADMDGFAEDAAAASGPAHRLMIAFRLEFTIMHPAFTAMFLLMAKQTGVASPVSAYHSHISGLIHQARKLGIADPNLELVADLMDRQWSVQLDLSQRLADIQDLRSLIPICAYCKNVRNDKGYWQKVEEYIEHHFPAEFSHGICPDCIRKHFPEYYEDEKK
jgi:hypothetical protein